MSSVRFLVVTLLVAVVFAAPLQALNSWTVALYFAGETGRQDALREESVIRQLIQMEKAGLPEGCSYLAQIETGHNTNEFVKEFYKKHNIKNIQRTLRLELQGNKWKYVTHISKVNMGAPQSVWSFLKWVKSKAARHFFVIFGGYGSGLFGEEGVGGVNSKEPGEVTFNPDSFVGLDQDDGDILTIFELRAVLEAFKDKLNRGKKIDILAFDTRFAASVEAFYELKDSAHIAIATPLDNMVGRFDYGAPARLLAENPRLFPEPLADLVTRAFIDKPGNDKGGDSVIGSWRLSEFEELGAAIDGMAMELLRAGGENGKKFEGGGYRYDYDDKTKDRKYWDVNNLCDAIISGKYTFTDDTEPKNKVQLEEAATYVKQALEATNITIYRNDSAATKRGLGGLNIVLGDIDEAFPRSWKLEGFRTFYAVTRFAQDFNWDKFIDHQMGVAGTGPIHEGF